MKKSNGLFFLLISQAEIVILPLGYRYGKI